MWNPNLPMRQSPTAKNTPINSNNQSENKEFISRFLSENPSVYFRTDEEQLLKKYNSFLDYVQKFINGPEMLKLAESFIHDKEKIPKLLIIKAFQLAVSLTKKDDKETIEALKNLVNEYYGFCTLSSSSDKAEHKYIIAPIMMFFRKFYRGDDPEVIMKVDMLMKQYFVGTSSTASSQSSSSMMMDVDEEISPLGTNKHKQNEGYEQTIKSQIDALFINVQVDEFVEDFLVPTKIVPMAKSVAIRHSLEAIFRMGFNSGGVSGIIVSLKSGNMINKVMNAINIFATNLPYCNKLIKKGFSTTNICKILYDSGIYSGECLKAIEDNMATFEKLVEIGCDMENIARLLRGSGSELPIILKELNKHINTFDTLIKLGFSAQSITDMYYSLYGLNINRFTILLTKHIKIFEHLVTLGFKPAYIAELFYNNYAAKKKLIKVFNESIYAFEFLINGMGCKCKQFSLELKANSKGIKGLAGIKEIITKCEVPHAIFLERITYIEQIKYLTDKLKLMIINEKKLKETLKYILSAGIEGDAVTDMNIILENTYMIKASLNIGYADEDILLNLKQAYFLEHDTIDP